jgi:hypothetical protein
MTMTTIRLACSECDRQDFDGISLEQLQQAKADGWSDISEMQSYEESCRTYENPADAPPGFDVTAWWTHLGVCPECNEENG